MRRFKSDRNSLSGLELASVGATLAFSIVIGAGAGWWVGDKLGNRTVGLIIGFILGTTAGFMEMFRAVARWNKRLEQQEQQRRDEDNDNGNSTTV